MGYYCLRCKRPVEIHNTGYQGVRCPYCGYRALRKERPTVVVKKLKAL
ncbi:MAG: DNA-directed RNA polymerase subunit P [Methanophagales archaeon ANME-1-THS]|nr:MAG: DNA-directed RNA polymerase subunit P [Methanophagales archaeon ANME-1-THS]